MGRVLAIVLALMTLVVLFIYSGNTTETAITTSQPDRSPIKLRFGHNTPEESALHQAALLFAEKVREKTDNRVVIDIFPAQQLGNDHKMVEMARTGELDIILTPTAKMSIPVPSMQYADLPFFFPHRSDVYAMLDGVPGQMLFSDLKKIGLHGAAFWENGFKHFTGNTPLTSPDQFINKKIRVMKSRIIMEQFKSFGAEPIAIDFHSTRQALADKVVDGQENPLIAIYSMGFHKEQSDLVLSEHAYLGYILSFSSRTIKKLPYDIQKALFESAQEVTPWEREETQKREKQLLENIKADGVHIHTLTHEQRAAFAARTSHIASRFEEIIGPALISKTEELLDDKYGSPANQDDHLVIGINADLSSAPVSGLAIKRGAQLAVKEINKRGGVLGKPLKLITRDHKIMTSHGLDNMRYFISRPDVVAVIGGKHSAIIAEDLSIACEANMPYLIPWGAAQEITENNAAHGCIFRVSANDKLASEFIVQEALKKGKKPALIVENTIWGRSNLQNMKQYLNAQGIPLVSEIVINRGQENYNEQLVSLLRSGADNVIMVTNAHESSIIIPELFKYNNNLPITSHWGLLGGNFVAQHKSILSKLNLTFFKTFLFNNSKRPQALKLKKAYQQAYSLSEGEEIRAQHAVAQSYDLVQLLALAIEQANSTDRQEIIDALENLPPHEGAVKYYKTGFTRNRHDGLMKNDYFMAQFNNEGRIIPVTKGK